MIGRRKGGIWASTTGSAGPRTAERRPPRVAADRRTAAREATQESPPPRRRRLILSGLVATALLAGAAFGPSGVRALWTGLRGERFAVQAIAVRGARRLPAREIARATAIAPGTSLVDVDVDFLVARIETLPGVISATALRLPPGKILVSVVERSPLAVVAAGDLGRPHVVCAEGVPFAVASARERTLLPYLERTRPALLGEADPELAADIALTATLRRAGFARPATLARITDQSGDAARVRLRGLSADILFDHSAPEDGVSRLARLVAERPDLVRSATTIDLRFAGRAVLRSTEPASKEANHAAAGRGYVPPPTPPRTG